MESVNYRRWWLLFMVAFTMVFGTHNFGRALLGPCQGQDFAQYYFASRQLLSGNAESIYLDGAQLLERAAAFGVKPVQGQVMRNSYPPFAAIFMIPVALLTYDTARYTFFIISLAALVCTIPCMFSNRPRWLRMELTGVGWIATLLYLPTYMLLSMGQVNAVLLLLCSLALVFIRRKQMVVAGLCIGLASAVKIFPLILLPLFLMRRQYRLFVATVTSFIAFTILSVAVCGIGVWRAFLGILSSEALLGAHFLNQSFSGFFGRLLTPNPCVASLGNHPELARILSLTCGLLVLLVILLHTRRTSSQTASTMRDDLEYGLYFTAAMLISGHALEPLSVFLLFSFLFIFESTIYSQTEAPTVFFLACVAYCIWAFIYTQLPRHMGVTMNIVYSAKFFGTVILLLANLLLLRRLQRDPEDLLFEHSHVKELTTHAEEV